MKRLFALMLAMIMMLSLVACGDSENASGDGELVEITVMVYDRGHEYPSGMSVIDNNFTKWVNEQMNPQGVKVTYVPVPRSGADNEINLMLTGEIAPDVIRTYDLQRIQGYAAEGGLCDLTPYMEMLDKEYLETAYLEAGKTSGGQYALPAIYSYHYKSKDMFLRQDLVEAIGREMPTTKAELIETLYALKEAYPDMTIWGMGGKNTNGNYEDFLVAYTSRKDDRINHQYEPTFTIALKPGHKEGLQIMNQLCKDGIIDKNFVLDTDNAKYDEGMANGNFAFIVDGNTDPVRSCYGTATDPNYHMIEINCMEDADGSYDKQSGGAWDYYTYVPKTAEPRLEAVMKYLAWQSKRDVAFEIGNGLLGLGYEMKDGQAIGFDRATRLANGTSSSPGDNKLLWSNFPMTMEERLAQQIASNPDVPAEVTEGSVYHQYNDLYHRAYLNEGVPADENAPLLNELIVQFVFKCIVAEDFEAEYAAGYQKLIDNGLQDLLDQRGEWYDKNK